MTDTERLAAIRERCERATPGPWQWDEPSNWHGTAARVCNESYDPIAQVQMSGWPRKIGKANAAFCAHARDDVPYLLALVDRLMEFVPVPRDNRRTTDPRGIAYLTLESLRVHESKDDPPSRNDVQRLLTAYEVHGIEPPEWLQAGGSRESL